MPTNRYYGDDIATFSVEINSTTITAGAVTEVSVRVEEEHDELFDPEDISFDQVKRREAAVIVEFTIREFDEELAQYCLDGSGTGTSTTLQNNSDVAQFDKVALEQNQTDHTGTAGDVSLKAVVENVHFSEVPLMEMAQGEYVEHQWSGRGNGVTFTKEMV